MMGKERNISLDVLRVLAMFMIVVTHSFVWGMPFQSPKSEIAANNLIFPLVSAFASCAVDSFVLISGYFLSRSYGMKFRKAGKIWIQTIFYTLLIWAVLRLTGVNGDASFVKSVPPIYNDIYWFVTQYLIMLLLSPFLARFCDAMDKKSYLCLLAVSYLLVGSIVSGFPLGHVLFPDCTTPLFLLLFFIAGYLARYDLPAWMERNCGKLFLAVIAIQWMGGIGLNVLYRDTGLIYAAFSGGNAGLSLFSSLFLFIWFRKRKWEDKKVPVLVSAFAPYAFGVYLLHDNPLLRPVIWDNLGLISKWDSYLFYPCQLASCILIFFICLAVDLARSKMFAAVGRITACLKTASGRIAGDNISGQTE